eukprot:392989-Rhodomonas_salina.1
MRAIRDLFPQSRQKQHARPLLWTEGEDRRRGEGSEGRSGRSREERRLRKPARCARGWRAGVLRPTP